MAQDIVSRAVEKQIEMFDPRKLARTHDPETSHDAAASVKIARTAQHQWILAVLRAEDRPMGAEELGDRIGLDVHRRIVELERANLIHKTDQKHRNRSGRQGYKYVAVPVAEE